MADPTIAFIIQATRGDDVITYASTREFSITNMLAQMPGELGPEWIITQLDQPVSMSSMDFKKCRYIFQQHYAQHVVEYGAKGMFSGLNKLLADAAKGNPDASD